MIKGKRRPWREIYGERMSAGDDAARMRLAVARRSRFEGNEFEVVRLPKLEIVAQGFETMEAAEQAASEFNAASRQRKDKSL